MGNAGVTVRFEAKPDKVNEVESFLGSLASQVQREESTIAWFGFRVGPTTYGVFHVFVDAESRGAHMAEVGEAVNARGSELFAAAPTVDFVDIVAAKTPTE
jgi:quinol monooxygenase YgiN